MKLEELGITRDELIERIVDRTADKALGFDPEDEDFGAISTESLESRIQDAVRERIDNTVKSIADEHILPNAQQYIENVTLQHTNSWGEKKGESVTFREYLVQRAHDYMTEQVDHDGYAKGEKNSMGGWRPYGTRIEHMIERHLKYHIHSAMEDAMKQANSSIAEGLNEAVRVKIDEIRNKIKVDVKGLR